MQRIILALAVAASLAATNPAHAEGDGFWDRFHLDFHRMNCWPEPFLHADRVATQTPLIAMTDAGWQLQNTLGDHFFDPQTQLLTQAGQLKLRWIATQTPLHRRTVLVLRSTDSAATVSRVQSVEEHLARLIPDAPRPDVRLTDKAPTGGSGEYFDEVDRQLKTTIPPPRLPGVSGAASGS